MHRPIIHNSNMQPAQPTPEPGMPNNYCKKWRVNLDNPIGKRNTPIGPHHSRWHFVRIFILRLPEEVQFDIWRMVHQDVIGQIKESVVHSSMLETALLHSTATGDCDLLVTLKWPRVQTSTLKLPNGHLDGFGMPQKLSSVLMPPPLQRSPLDVNPRIVAYCWTIYWDLPRRHCCTKRNRARGWGPQGGPHAYHHDTTSCEWCHLAPLALIQWLD